MRYLLYALLVGLLACSPKTPAPINWDGFSCHSGKKDWLRAKVVTPDVVPPCHSGSGGMCVNKNYQYVSGTGWCRPL
ncbi:MAG: hypothetical protein IPP76_13665 [Moraxellaceae bacterium]|nr:hypothetical protein [Moraxellaceae bacterium]